MPSRSQWKVWRSLARRKGREETGLFLLEGPRLLGELLGGGVLPEQVLHTEAASDDERIAALLERCRAAGVPVDAVSERRLAELADTVTPQGLLAVARIPRGGWKSAGVPRLLVLDAVQDPGNLGTLARTAEAMGLGGILCLPGTVDPWNAKAVRAAAGSTLRVPVLSVSWEETEAHLRSDGIPLWAADAEGEPVRRSDPAPTRLALALGNEARGVSEPVRTAAARMVAVPMAGRVESLNVAVAGAILMDRLFGNGSDEGKGMGRGDA